MNWAEWLAWLVLPTEAGKAAIWRHATGNADTFHYTNCPTIKAFWRSPLGRAYRFWILLRYHVRSIPRKIATLRWWLGWRLRHWYRNFLEVEIERTSDKTFKLPGRGFYNLFNG